MVTLNDAFCAFMEPQVEAKVQEILEQQHCSEDISEAISGEVAEQC